MKNKIFANRARKNIVFFLSKSYLFFVIISSIIITGIIISIIVKSLGQFDSNKIQLIQPILLVLVGVLPTIAATLITEIIKFRNDVRQKEIGRREEMLLKREAMYKSILENIDGFFIPENEDKKAIFFSQYRVAWLYANDDVLRAINNFLNSVNRENPTPMNRAVEFYQTILFSMRKDIIALEPLNETALERKEVNNTGSANRR